MCRFVIFLAVISLSTASFVAFSAKAVIAQTTSCSDFSDNFNAATLNSRWKDSLSEAIITNGRLSHALSIAEPSFSDGAYTVLSTPIEGDFEVTLDLLRISALSDHDLVASNGLEISRLENGAIDGKNSIVFDWVGSKGSDSIISFVTYFGVINGVNVADPGFQFTNYNINTTIKFVHRAGSFELYFKQGSGDYTFINTITAFNGPFQLSLYSGVSDIAQTNSTTPVNIDYDNFSLSCLASSGGIPVYRFFNLRNGAHLYTTSEAERNTVQTLTSEWLYEGAKFNVFADPGTNLVPVFRFWNKENGAHLYTTSATERDTILNTLPKFQFEGTKYYVYSSEIAGSKPVYRFFNTINGAHLYTISETERNTIQTTLPQFKYEGIAYYVL